jgi:hypothetical protein
MADSRPCWRYAHSRCSTRFPTSATSPCRPCSPSWRSCRWCFCR